MRAEKRLGWICCDVCHLPVNGQNLVGDCLRRHGPRVFDVSRGNEGIEAGQKRAQLAGQVFVAGRAEDQSAPRRGKQVRKVSARAMAEATLWAPSITSQGFWPATSTLPAI